MSCLEIRREATNALRTNSTCHLACCRGSPTADNALSGEDSQGSQHAPSRHSHQNRAVTVDRCIADSEPRHWDGHRAVVRQEVASHGVFPKVFCHPLNAPNGWQHAGMRKGGIGPGSKAVQRHRAFIFSATRQNSGKVRVAEGSDS